MSARRVNGEGRVVRPRAFACVELLVVAAAFGVLFTAVTAVCAQSTKDDPLRKFFPYGVYVGGNNPEPSTVRKHPHPL